MYLGYQRVNVTSAVKTSADLTIPARATHCDVVAEVGNVRYTMDGSTNPSASLPSGMVFKPTDPPKSFLIEDILRIKFCSETQGGDPANEALNFHFSGGRDV